MDIVKANVQFEIDPRPWSPYTDTAFADTTGAANSGVEHHSIVSQRFTQSDGSVPHSQEPYSSAFPESDNSSPHHSILSLQDSS
jgi:hypothetical protein